MQRLDRNRRVNRRLTGSTLISPSSADLGGARSTIAAPSFPPGLVPRLMNRHGVAGVPFWSTHRLTPQAQSSLSSRQGGRRAGAIPGALEYPRCRSCRRRGGCWPGARLLTLHLPKRWPWGGKGQSRPGPAASHSAASLTAPVRH